ncbi:hypothetical protein LTS18_013860, partial [Coniosporium uncinatum]
MPYTPPSQRSPATSTSNSPNISRSHSYSEEPPRQTTRNVRPSLPRSASSTAYMQKHRRSPSISDQQDTPQADVVPTVNGYPSNGTYLNLQIYTDIPLIKIEGHESPQSSDDEDRSRRRQLEELQQALRSMELKRGCSPVRIEDPSTEVPAAPNSTPAPGHISPALSAEARKISHSRSSSELHLSTHRKDGEQSPNTTGSDDSDCEEDGLRMKPPLLRKKSGELVKPALRPSSRRRPSSMPGTPTFSKAVHFNEDMEQVRHFLQVDRPIAVSAGSSPVETLDSETEYPFGYEDGYKAKPVEWDIRLTNFPRETFERKAAPVTLERLFLSSDNKTLIGNVSVANIAFSKFV